MRKQRFFFSLCLACLLMSACVSKEKYEEIEATLSDTQAKLEQKNKQVQELESKLKDSEESRNTCRQDIAGLQARCEELEKSQQQLSATLEQTRSELEKISALARQREVAIQEADKSKRQLETRLQSPLGKLLLANSITLTPGTLSVDVQDARILVHWVDCPPGADLSRATRTIAESFERHISGFLK